MSSVHHFQLVLVSLGGSGVTLVVRVVFAVSVRDPQVSALHADDNAQVRRTAVHALEKMGPRAGPHIRGFLNDVDGKVVHAATNALSVLGCSDRPDEDAELSEVD